MNRYIKRGCKSKAYFSWAFLVAGLFPGTPVLAAFTDDIAQGLDNDNFYYLLSQEDTFNEPMLVAGEGIGAGDAVQVGSIGSYTDTRYNSASMGFRFSIEGPGTLTFQWRVNGQEIIGGTGAYFEYQLLDQSFGRIDSGVITGSTNYQLVEVDVPAGSSTFYINYIRSLGSNFVGQDSGFIDQLLWNTGGGNDTTPDAFSFSAQASVPLSTLVNSNTVAIGGIDAAADIGISSCSSTCEYSINGGVWTSSSAAGAVSNGDSIGVRQMSSPSYATATMLTLDIGGVTAPFNVTTEPAPIPVPVVVGPTPTGTGTARAFVEAAGNSAPGCSVSEAAFLDVPVAPPEGVTLDHGMFGFTSTGCTGGFSVNVTVEYPSDIPPGASYWKYDEDAGWYTIPATIVGDTVSFTITDGGVGDSNSAAGSITDPGGIGMGGPATFSAEAIPSMTWWSIAALILGMTTLAMSSMLRRTT